MVYAVDIAGIPGIVAIVCIPGIVYIYGMAGTVGTYCWAAAIIYYTGMTDYVAAEVKVCYACYTGALFCTCWIFCSVIGIITSLYLAIAAYFWWSFLEAWSANFCIGLTFFATYDCTTADFTV